MTKGKPGKIARPRIKAKKEQQLLQRIEELESRLAEGEEIRAIREGEVDAIEVSGSRGKRIFSLSGSESIYRRIVETMSEAAFTVALDGSILYCNTQFGRLVRRGSERIVGHSLREFIAEPDKESLPFLLNAAQKKPTRQRLVFRDADGNPVPAHICATVLNEPDETSVCIVANDLTELENSAGLIQRLGKRQSALEESEKRFRLLFENSPDAVFLTVPDGQILAANPAACSMFGMSESELCQAGRQGIADPEDDRFPAALEERRRLGRLINVETNYVRKNGEKFTGEIDSVILPGSSPLQSFVIIRDITERKRAESELRRSRDTLKAVLDAAPAGIMVFDPSGRTLFSSAEVERILDGPIPENAFGPDRGFEVCRLDGTPFPEEYLPLTQALEGRTVTDTELLIKRSDGRRIVIQASATPLGSGDGELQGAITVFKDITDRKHAEKALQDTEKRFRAVLENMSEGLMLFDIDGNPIYQNPASLRIHGFGDYETGRAEKGIPSSRWDVRDIEDRVVDIDDWPTYRVLRRHERFQNQMLHVRCKDTGQEFFASYNGSPIYGADGKVKLGFVTIRDITEQIRTQSELALRERRLRVFFESDMVGIMFWTMDGRIIDANDKFLQMVGYSREDVVSHRIYWSRMTPPEYRGKDEYALGQLRDTGVATPYEKEYIRNDGSRIPIIKGIAMLDERLYEGVAFVLDISERKRAEKELKLAQESAEQASRAKDHFLAVLSHELRTPLTPVIMGISMLQDRSDMSPDMRKTIEIIRSNVEMEARLIDDLLDVTRIARGKIELNRTPVNLCTVINRAVEVCKPDIESRGLEFGMDLGPAPACWVEGDASRLEQVFWNLLKNAVKFTPHGGRVGIRCRQNNQDVFVEVSDSGIGIGPEAMNRVFNAFEQAEQSITRQFGGLGLGLAISKAIVELHGGQIEAHSEGQGKGSIFRIRLPLIEPVQKTEAPAPGSYQPVFSPLHILLVEDHGVTARMIRMILAEQGHSVEIAGDMATALELAGRQEFDLLLSDLGLPDGSGHDLMRELRAHGYTLPGIALSGYGQEEDIRKSHEAGFAVHLTKPASRESVLETVASFAERDPVRQSPRSG